MAKFPWGDQPNPMGLMCGLMVVTALALGVLLALTGTEGAAVPETALHPVAVVTCVFCLMWYIFLGNQVGIKFTQGLPDDVAATAKNIADRSVGNTMEQAIPFLVLLWLEAVFVNPRIATILGWIYVVFRFFYPVFFGMYGTFTVLVEASTQPNYIVIFYFLLTVLFKCAFDIDLHATISATSPWLMLPFMLGVGLCAFIVFLLLAKPTTMLIIAGAKKEKGFKDPEADDEDEEE